MSADGSVAGVVDFGALRFFGGFDWPLRSKTDVVVVDDQGRVVLRLCFDDRAEGWAPGGRSWARWAGRWAWPSRPAGGEAVERLLDLGLAVYPERGPPKGGRRNSAQDMVGWGQGLVVANMFRRLPVACL